ncbi:MAG: hypothetical protein M1833_003468 [Piccolia ochrophora]|nr:MAG: hypothetical protein M1833_003468 [Piccolia ochrophora]
MHLTLATLALWALSVDHTVARPSATHQHLHRHTAGLDKRQYNLEGIDFAKIYAEKVAPTSAGDAGGAGGEGGAPGPDIFKIPKPAWDYKDPKYLWDAFGGRTINVDAGHKDVYVGNIGKPEGSNIAWVPNELGEKYKYAVKFVNVSPAPMDVMVWNKANYSFAGVDAWKNGPNAGQSAAAPTVRTTIGVKESATVVLDENTQFAWGQDTGRRRPDSGAFDTTFGEGNVGDLRGEYLGFNAWDVSSIQNGQGNVAHMVITCQEAEGDKSKESSHTGNNFVTDKDPDSNAPSIPPGPMHLTVEMGGQPLA